MANVFKLFILAERMPSVHAQCQKKGKSLKKL